MFDSHVKVVGTAEDAPEGGGPTHELDLEYRTLKGPSRWRVKRVAASYTVDLDQDSGSLLVVSAAATITLPAITSRHDGLWVRVAVIADVDVTVATETADTLICFNDVDGDSIAVATAGQKVGATFDFIALHLEGKWLACPLVWEDQQVDVTD